LGASLFTRFMSHFIKVADDNPGWRAPLVLGWAGMRGVVSLAAALSIPILLSKNHPFPFRNLILFITFVVILVTLVIQGLTLPWIIRKVKPENKYNTITEQQQEIIIQKKIAEASLQLIEQKYGKDRSFNDHLNILNEKLKIDLSFFSQEFEEINTSKDNSLKNFQHIYLEILQHQRNILNEMNKKADFDEELIRKYFALLDLEEYNIREKLIETT
jgi:monovalent cation/hydrogen antiporter